MPIHHAALALLADGPRHGYGLKLAFERAIGPQWGPLNIGHVYQVLERLTRDGHVRCARTPGDGRDRVTYEITESGRDELARWIGEPSPRTAGFRDDFFLKVMAAAQSRQAATVNEVAQTQRAFLLRELRNLEQLRRERSADVVVALLLTAAARHVAADLSFVDDIEEVLLADNGSALASIAAGAPSPAAPPPAGDAMAGDGPATARRRSA